MCGSSKTGSCCCPTSQIIQENLCGNFAGPLDTFRAWSAPTPNDYVQGTFEIFNAGPETIIVNLVGNVGIGYDVPPGTTSARSILRPSLLLLSVPEGTSGKFCLTLYKRLTV